MIGTEQNIWLARIVNYSEMSWLFASVIVIPRRSNQSRILEVLQLQMVSISNLKPFIQKIGIENQTYSIQDYRPVAAVDVGSLRATQVHTANTS